MVEIILIIVVTTQLCKEYMDMLMSAIQENIKQMKLKG